MHGYCSVLYTVLHYNTVVAEDWAHRALHTSSSYLLLSKSDTRPSLSDIDFCYRSLREVETTIFPFLHIVMNFQRCLLLFLYCKRTCAAGLPQTSNSPKGGGVLSSAKVLGLIILHPCHGFVWEELNFFTEDHITLCLDFWLKQWW